MITTNRAEQANRSTCLSHFFFFGFVLHGHHKNPKYPGRELNHKHFTQTLPFLENYALPTFLAPVDI